VLVSGPGRACERPASGLTRAAVSSMWAVAWARRLAFRQNADVSLGGGDRAAVPEKGLDGFQVVVGGEVQAGRAVPQVVQPHRRQVQGADPVHPSASAC
jgi:hypothetical protein